MAISAGIGLLTGLGASGAGLGTAAAIGLGAGAAGLAMGYQQSSEARKAAESARNNALKAYGMQPPAPPQQTMQGQAEATSARDRQKQKAAAAGADRFSFTGPRGIPPTNLGGSGSGYKTTLGG